MVRPIDFGSRRTYGQGGPRGRRSQRSRAPRIEALEPRTLLAITDPMLQALLGGAGGAQSFGEALAGSAQLGNGAIDIPIVADSLGAASNLGSLFRDAFAPVISTLGAAGTSDAQARAFLDTGLFSTSATPIFPGALEVTFSADAKPFAFRGAGSPSDLGFGGSADPYISEFGTALFDGPVTATAQGRFAITFGARADGQFYIRQGELFDNAGLDLAIADAGGSFKVRSLPFGARLDGSAELGLRFGVNLTQTLIGPALTAQGLADAAEPAISGSASLEGSVTATVLGLDAFGWTAALSWDLGTSPDDPGVPAITGQRMLMSEQSLADEFVGRLVGPILPDDLFGISDWGLNVQDLFEVAGAVGQIQEALGLLSAITAGNSGSGRAGLSDERSDPTNLAMTARSEANSDLARWDFADTPEELLALALGNEVELASYTFDPAPQTLFEASTGEVTFATGAIGPVTFRGFVAGELAATLDYGLKVGVDTRGAFLDTDVTQFGLAVTLGGLIGVDIDLAATINLATARVGLVGGPELSVSLRPTDGAKFRVTAADLSDGLPGLGDYLRDSVEVRVGITADAVINVDANTPLGSVVGLLPEDLRGPTRDLLVRSGLPNAAEVGVRAVGQAVETFQEEICENESVRVIAGVLSGGASEVICRVVTSERIAAIAPLALGDNLIILDAIARELGVPLSPGGNERELVDGYSLALAQLRDNPGLYVIPDEAPLRERGSYTWVFDLTKAPRAIDRADFDGGAAMDPNSGAEADTIRFTFQNNVLSIVGTDDVNTVLLNDLGGGVVELVRRTDLAGGGGDFDPIVQFTNVGSIVVDLLGGDDTFSMSAGLTARATVRGGDGSDRITTGAGDDVIDSGLGAMDTVTSNEGIDRITLAGDGGTASGGGGNDTIFGSGGDDSVTGGEGDDVLIGGQGNDSLMGGEGNDSLFGEAGDDTLLGGAGEDAIDSGAGENFVDGGLDDDTIMLRGGNNTARGGGGDDSITGSAGIDSIDGGSGDDILLGGGGDDDIRGGDGDDTVDGGAGDDSIRGEDGNDYLEGGAGDDQIQGQAGADRLFGGDDSDGFLWEVGDGDDRFEGGTGNDSILLLGTDASDDFLVSAGAIGVVVTHGPSPVVRDAQLVLNATEIVGIIASRGADAIRVDDLSTTDLQQVAFNLGDDQDLDLVRLRGRSTADQLSLTVRQGVDLTGNSVPFVSVAGLRIDASVAGSRAGADRIEVETVEGDDEVAVGAGVVGLVDLAIDGGSGDDSLFGDGTLIGGLGDDTLQGGPGAGSLMGGDGDDTLILSGGSDTLSGGAGADVVRVDGDGSADVVALTQNGTSIQASRRVITTAGLTAVFEGTASVAAGDIERIEVATAGGDDAVTLVGLAIATRVDLGAGNDSGDAAGVVAVTVTLIGGEGDDLLVGGSFADRLEGGTGDDVLDGGPGADLVMGGDGRDTLRHEVDGGSDRLEGGEDDDTAITVGSGGVDGYMVTPDGARVRVEHAGAGFVLTVADVEQLDLVAGGGADAVEVADLANTGLRAVTVDLGAGDGARDVVTFLGRPVDDEVAWTVVGAAVQSSGLAVRAIVVGGSGADDVLAFRAGGGNDRVTAAFDVTAMVRPLLDGGAGDDVLEADGDLVGGAGDDTLTGGPGANTIVGGAGADAIVGAGGDDVLLGDAHATGAGDGFTLVAIATGHGDDSIDGGDGHDTINGDLGDDTMIAGAGDDRIGALAVGGLTLAEAGDDRIEAGSGRDAIDAGDGDDSVLGGDGNDTIAGGLGADTIDAGGDDDAVDGGAGDDTIDGGSGADAIHGQDGNDTLIGRSGADALTGGAGDDAIDGGDDDDAIDGGAGHDTLVGGAGRDWLFGREGNDALDGGDGDDALDGAEGNDLLVGGAGVDLLDGAEGDDRLDGGSEADELDGGVGNDVLIGGAGADRLFGRDGNDAIDGGDGDDSLDGELGDDALTGGAGDDVLAGGDGADVLSGGDGRDTLDGGAGDDTIVGGNDDDLLLGQGGSDRLDGDGGNDVIDGGDGDDRIDGGTGDDRINGRGGNDTMLGGDGDDILVGDEGNDRLEGGVGNDTLAGERGNDALMGGDGIDLLVGDVGDDVLDGGAGDDTIDAGPGRDLLTGGLGNDTMTGGADADTLDGGAGDDSLDGGAGADRLEGGHGRDSLAGRDGVDSLDGGAGDDDLDGGAGADSLAGGAGNDILRGGLGDDSLDGQEDDDFLMGGDGQDRIDGGAGNDALAGEAGDDRIDGGDGRDVAIGGAGNDHLIGGADNDQLHGGEGNDLIDGGAGDDDLFGGAGDDMIFGGDGRDLILGQEGNDAALGGFGADQMFGGAGDDVLHGGNGIPNVPLTVRPILPDDGDDTIHGGDGRDHVDGGNGNNILDAGDDGIREIVVSGRGVDIAFGHRNQDGLRDEFALDGGRNRIYVQGGLVDPVAPAESLGRVSVVVVTPAPVGPFVEMVGDTLALRDDPLTRPQRVRFGSQLRVTSTRLAPARRAATLGQFRRRGR